MNTKIKNAAILLFFPLAILAQESDARLAAFSTSYEAEYFKKYAEAIIAMDKIYAQDSYEVNLRLGWLHYQNGNYSKSDSYYKKAVELQPKSIEAKLGLANAISGLGNWDELMKLYEDILKLDPMNSSANYKLAYMLHSRRKMAQALDHIKIVLEHYPFDFDSNLLAGKIYISLGNITEAKTVLNRALTYNPKSFEVSNLLKGL